MTKFLYTLTILNENPYREGEFLGFFNEVTTELYETEQEVEARLFYKYRMGSFSGAKEEVVFEEFMEKVRKADFNFAGPINSWFQLRIKKHKIVVSADKKTNIFVYGALMKSYGRSGTEKTTHIMLKDSKYLGKDTLEGFQMRIYENEKKRYPYITPTQNSDNLIYGEVYEVDESVLNAIDTREDYHINRKENSVYNREIKTTSKGKKVWVYISNPALNPALFNPKEDQLVGSGKWDRHQWELGGIER
jgi:gamma-glutamylcyclotransferase (GGCT)/AIG2-like uncharacterized protein YtfP